MTYYTKHKFSTNDVTAAVAEAVLKDHRINHLGFQGFPAITAQEAEDSFEIYFAHGNKAVGPLSVPFQTGKAFAKAFQKKQAIADEWFREVQDMLVKLELACYGER